MIDSDNHAGNHAGFCLRLLMYLCDRALKNGVPGPSMNGRVLTIDEMQIMVANARRRGWLR